MQQLTFELAAPEPPTFANFVAGRNGEVVAILRQLADGTIAETGILLWGGQFSGRTHLLHATVAAARGPSVFHMSAESVPAEPPAPAALVVIDDVQNASAAAQGRLFTLYNALRETGGHLLVAADAPPSRLSLREDIRTRLGWGLIFEIAELADAEKALALAGYARERGVPLTSDVVAWLLAHGRRDMSTLTATLQALDRYSLATKRPITVPLAREWSRQAGDLFGERT
ncbi:MAG: DnaA regulatory inactivator Hda [Betaproteobacteria bacterium]